MNNFTPLELEEALRAIHSTIGKCEKAQPKLMEGTSQHSLLERRIKAFHIAASLIEAELHDMDAVDGSKSSGAIYEYQRLLQTTDLQKGYQEFIKFFRRLRAFLQKELPEFAFTGNIVENNMDYSYFQFTNEELKTEGLKFVISFVHADFEYQIWLSGMNRKAQTTFQQHVKSMFPEVSSTYPYPLMLTDNPTKTDYIIKASLLDEVDYNRLGEVMAQMKKNTLTFAAESSRLRTLVKLSQL